MDKTTEKINELLSRMTVKEKALALTGSSMFKVDGNKEKGIPAVYFLDGGTGLNYQQMFCDCFYRECNTGCDGWAEMIDDASGIADRMLRMQDLILGRADDIKPHEVEEKERLAVGMDGYAPGGKLPGCFAPGILLGSTWDEETVYETGSAVGKEADFYGIDVLLGSPNVNIHRDPLNGRLFEGYSEDPYLCGKLAPEFVKGVQAQGIAANVKHFAANNQETDRRTVNEHISERALREIYLQGFRRCVEDGGCKTVMSAYNLINGTACSMNKWLLTDVLRGDWGFDGFVVCDWGGAYNKVESLKAGNDVDMPGPRKVDDVLAAVESGELDEAVLDECLRRFWKTVLSIPSCTEGHKLKDIDRAYSTKAAYDSVREGLILLKNEDSTLPLKADVRVSVFGEKSKKLIESGGGSACILTDQTSNLYDSISDIIGAANLSFESESDADAYIVTVGAKGQEGFDRKNLEIDPKDKIALAKAIVAGKKYGKPVIAVLNTCGPLNLMPYIDDLAAVICIFIPGMEGGHACADAIFGRFCPSGKLPLTFPKRYMDCPTYGNFPGWNADVMYGEDIFVGYRFYDARNIEPLFPFGHGLSYTTFEISGASLDKKELDIDKKDAGGRCTETAVLSVSIKNTGSMTGKEVVQLYIGQDNPTMAKPVKELKQFKKVELAPGEEKTVTFTLTEEDFVSYDTIIHGWSAEPDTYHLYVAVSSRDIRDTVDITLTGYNPYGFNKSTTMGVIASAEGALETFSNFCPETIFTREAIEWSILFQPSGTLEDWWTRRVEPMLEESEEAKAKRYADMLKAMNRYK